MSSSLRKSGLDLLKIIGLILIIMMHICGTAYNDANLPITNSLFFAILNAIGNTAVSCFMLITGYFGLRIKKDRIIRLWILIFLSSVLSGIINFYIFDRNIIKLIRSFFPILMCKSWYFTCYFVILSLSGFIQKLIDILNQKSFITLIIILLFWFSVFPTFLYYNITNDCGKGICNLLLIYLIGRYISKYIDIDKISLDNLIKVLIACIIIITTLNYSSTLIFSSFKNFFAYDNSFFIIIESISIFLLFTKLKFAFSYANELSTVTPVAFFIEDTVTKVILSNCNIYLYTSKPLFPALVLIMSLFVLIISYILLFLFKVILLPLLFRVLLRLIDFLQTQISYRFNSFNRMR